MAGDYHTKSCYGEESPHKCLTSSNYPLASLLFSLWQSLNHKEKRRKEGCFIQIIGRQKALEKPTPGKGGKREKRRKGRERKKVKRERKGGGGGREEKEKEEEEEE